MNVSAEAREVHARARFVDLHCDLLLATHLIGWDWQARHRPHPLPGAPLFGHCDLPRLREANVGCVALGVVVNPWWGSVRHVDLDLDQLDRELERAGGDLVLGGDAAAVRAAWAEGRTACFAGLEGAHALGGRLDELPRLRARGLRYVGLCHFTRSEACAPMVGWRASNTAPLTDFGRALVDELGRLRMLVDLAHAGRAAALEAARRAKGPVLCSHTACTAVHRSPRGIDDEVARAIADTDGVVGIIFVSPFVGPGGTAQVARHLDHLRRTVGVRHAALGTDWEGFATYPRELAGPEGLPGLVQALLDLGWSAEEVLAVAGENFLRVYAATCGG